MAQGLDHVTKSEPEFKGFWLVYTLTPMVSLLLTDTQNGTGVDKGDLFPSWESWKGVLGGQMMPRSHPLQAAAEHRWETYMRHEMD